MLFTSLAVLNVLYRAQRRLFKMKDYYSVRILRSNQLCTIPGAMVNLFRKIKLRFHENVNCRIVSDVTYSQVHKILKNTSFMSCLK